MEQGSLFIGLTKALHTKKHIPRLHSSNYGIKMLILKVKSTTLHQNSCECVAHLKLRFVFLNVQELRQARLAAGVTSDTSPLVDALHIVVTQLGQLGKHRVSVALLHLRATLFLVLFIFSPLSFLLVVFYVFLLSLLLLHLPHLVLQAGIQLASGRLFTVRSGHWCAEGKRVRDCKKPSES